MSTAAAPKLHKYRDVAPELAKTRPPPGHDHVSRTIIILRPVPLPVLMNLLTTGGGGGTLPRSIHAFHFTSLITFDLEWGGGGGTLIHLTDQFAAYRPQRRSLCCPIRCHLPKTRLTHFVLYSLFISTFHSLDGL